MQHYLELSARAVERILRIFYTPFKEAGWPLTVFLVAWLLRSELRDFLGRIRKVKFPGGEVEVEPGDVVADLPSPVTVADKSTT